MDTSEKYIRMSIEATELQETYNPHVGDYAVRACEYGHQEVGIVAWRYDQHHLWWMLNDGTDGITLHGDNSQQNYLEKLNLIPKQDQLQKIYSDWFREQYSTNFSNDEKEFIGIDKKEFIKEAFLDFATWLNKQYLPEPFTCVPTNCFESGEQLWLAFIMQTAYHYVWQNDSWIEVKK